MTATPLRDFVTGIDSKVSAIFLRNKIITPMWHAVTANGEHFITPSPHEDKDMASLLMRALFVLRDVVTCVFIDEAWILHAPKLTEAQLSEIAQKGLSNHPGRVEVLMYAAEDATGELMAHRLIIRESKDQPRLGPLQFMETPRESRGRFVGMLPRRETVQ